MRDYVSHVPVSMFKEGFVKTGTPFTWPRLYGMAIEQSLMLLVGCGGTVTDAVQPSCLVGGLRTVGEKNFKLSAGAQGLVKESLEALWSALQDNRFNVQDVDAGFNGYGCVSGGSSLFHDIVGTFVQPQGAGARFVGLTTWELFCTQSQDEDSAAVRSKMQKTKSNFAKAGQMFQHQFLAIIFFRVHTVGGAKTPSIRSLKFFHLARGGRAFKAVFQGEVPARAPAALQGFDEALEDCRTYWVRTRGVGHMPVYNVTQFFNKVASPAGRGARGSNRKLQRIRDTKNIVTRLQARGVGKTIQKKKVYLQPGLGKNDTMWVATSATLKSIFPHLPFAHGLP